MKKSCLVFGFLTKISGSLDLDGASKEAFCEYSNVYGRNRAFASSITGSL